MGQTALEIRNLRFRPRNLRFRPGILRRVEIGLIANNEPSLDAARPLKPWEVKQLRSAQRKLAESFAREQFDRVYRTPPLKSPERSEEYIIYQRAKRYCFIEPPNLSQFHLWQNRPMMSSVQFVTTPTVDTPGTTLLLSFDNRKYLFGNVSEGTQRACIQRGIGLKKIEDLFITGKTEWATNGGLLGVILTLGDIVTSSAADRKMWNTKAKREKTEEEIEKVEMKKPLRIHGGRNLTHLLATARRFIFRQGVPLYTNEIREGPQKKNWSPMWDDENIKVWAMVVSPEDSSTEPPMRSRKRSLEEISDDAEHPVNLDDVPVKETSEEAENRYDQMREAVVRQMFGGTWTLDSLAKTPLSEVKLPAKIFVRDDQGKIQEYSGPLPGEGQAVPDIEVLVRRPWPATLITSLPPTRPSQTALSYIVKGQEQRGKFDQKKAIELGATPGPDFGKLARGLEVESSKGGTVKPDDVMGPNRPGGGFALMEIPSDDYIEPLLKREEWGAKEVMDGVGFVVWTLGAGVKVEGRLQKFMTDHPEFEHIVSSPDYCANYLALESPAAAAIRLHQIDADHYPIPVHSNAPKVLWKSKDKIERPFHIARIGQAIGLYPSQILKNENIVQYLDTAAVVDEASPELLELAETARKEVNDAEFLSNLEERQKDIPSKDAEVIALGTGSALPSKYRNVSATIVLVPGYGNYLFDCGENTLGQLQRVFGPELPTVLRNLKMIWISHLHADHHLGTTAVIKAWHLATQQSPDHSQDRLLVASDKDMINFLEEYSCMEDFGYDRVESLKFGREAKLVHEFTPEQTQSWGLSLIKTCQVSHCLGALAIAITLPNGFKVAYSGDCRPSNNFVHIGQGATVLIHEATFDDEMATDAVAKKHSTTGEALDIGKRMGARRILLTHFSQRYQKIPIMSDREGNDDVKAGLCFDYMRIKVGDIAKLEAFRPALLKLYEEEVAEQEEKKEKAAAEEEGTPETKKEKKQKKNKKGAQEPQPPKVAKKVSRRGFRAEYDN